jgi:hypothetical protein
MTNTIGEENNILLVYLPPYNPQLNPIEDLMPVNFITMSLLYYFEVGVSKRRPILSLIENFFPTLSSDKIYS